jgi:hypothetical protein
MPAILIPISVLASFLIGRLTAPNHGVVMSILLSVLEHPVIFLTGLVVGYLAPSNVPTVAAGLLSLGKNALAYIKSKL